MQWRPPYNKGASTDPKKHFEVINFILGHFVNFLEEIYQEKFLDVSSPLKKCTYHVCGANVDTIEDIYIFQFP